MISDPHDLYRFATTPGIEVTSVLFFSDDVVWAAWRYSDVEIVPNLRHTNVVVGAYVTAGACLRLYAYLDSLQDRSLYCDTNSVFYIQKDNEPALI
jgi:hypothetical protein